MDGTTHRRARIGWVIAGRERVAVRVNRDPEFVREQVADGLAVIPPYREPEPKAGAGTSSHHTGKAG